MGLAESKQGEGRRWSFGKRRNSKEQEQVVFLDEADRDEISAEMRRQVKKLIMYAHSADPGLQREVRYCQI